MQFAADFFSNKLYYRSTNGNGSSAWSRVLNSSDSPYAANMNQHVRTSDSPTFAGMTMSQNARTSYAANSGWG